MNPNTMGEIMELTFTCVEKPTETQLFLNGKLTSSSAESLQEKTSEIFDGTGRLILDLKDLTYISSAGLRVMFLLEKKAHQGGGELILRNLCKSVWDVMELTGSLDILNVETAESNQDDSPIEFFEYHDLTNIGFFEELLTEHFRASGHNREIRFHPWDCYDGVPKEKGDLYCYDSFVYSALCSREMFQEIPTAVHENGIFEWMLDSTLFRRKRMGIPFLSCSIFLICREENAGNTENIYDLKGKLSTPLKSLMENYYLMALCDTETRSEYDSEEHLFSGVATAVVKQLKRLLGSEEAFQKSKYSDYEGYSQFLNGETDYFLGFSEFLRLFGNEHYVIKQLPLSRGQEKMPLYQEDLLSIARDVSGSKLRDCIDLVNIMLSPQFQWELCRMNGDVQYMLPANEKAFASLAEEYPLYQTLLQLTSDDRNKTLRFGTDFYEAIPQIRKALYEALEQEKLE